jgi:prevent-host-death family protein
MLTISIEDAKARLAEYIKRAEEGETIILTRRNQPVAELRPISKKPDSPRPIGLCAGEFTVPDNFDEPLPETRLKDLEG